MVIYITNIQILHGMTATTAVVCIIKAIAKKGVSLITKNQIEYLKHLEQQRSNLANEDLTRARDTATRMNAENVLAEQRRHSLVQEAQAVASLDEQSRSNKAREQLTSEQNVIAREHNKAMEGIQSFQAQEVARSNRAREAENFRANTTNEDLKRQSISADLAMAAEKAALGYSELHERQRSNLAQESISRSANAERKRANLEQEREQRKHNRETEYETMRSNSAREFETQRSNRAKEKNQQIIAYSQAANAGSRVADTIVNAITGGLKLGGNLNAKQTKETQEFPIFPWEEPATEVVNDKVTSGPLPSRYIRIKAR